MTMATRFHQWQWVEVKSEIGQTEQGEPHQISEVKQVDGKPVYIVDNIEFQEGELVSWNKEA
jgi:hypothetical protein